ncbi:hypothetical protein L1987_77964 [Smallanthus sonchifolius]|uniref:Uncharacterized protein n=1 Tax=Smallanthus sonchifolius TaxID=185202 RepID=A0ACB8ZBJ3_9ASTR|nr:hypothetical protein L1987_77964 [Smallanthus sonchifolius]
MGECSMYEEKMGDNSDMIKVWVERSHADAYFKKEKWTVGTYLENQTESPNQTDEDLCDQNVGDKVNLNDKDDWELIQCKEWERKKGKKRKDCDSSPVLLQSPLNTHQSVFALKSIFSLFCNNNQRFTMAATDYGLMIGMMMAVFMASFVSADPDLLQDVCVADLNSGVKLNGFACKSNTSANDFFFAGLAKPGLTNNTFGATVTPANVLQITGLNTLGVSMARIDYAPGGLNPPHTHPRATEIVFVLEGALDVGFITTDNKLFSKTIKKGEIFTFPRGLIHFQINNGKVPAAVIAGFNSQLPGTQRVADALFASSPTVNDVVLTKAFQVGTEVVEKIKSKFALKKTCDNVGKDMIKKHSRDHHHSPSPPPSRSPSPFPGPRYALNLHYLIPTDDVFPTPILFLSNDEAMTQD